MGDPSLKSISRRYSREREREREGERDRERERTACRRVVEKLFSFIETTDCFISPTEILLESAVKKQILNSREAIREKLEKTNSKVLDFKIQSSYIKLNILLRELFRESFRPGIVFRAGSSHVPFRSALSQPIRVIW